MVSIIVPIFNAAKYLSQCIESLINQAYQDIEILLIDDGSTDESPMICNRYRKKDQRVRYIRKENGGVSSARNEGIRHAKGDYLTFVDSDDYLDGNIIKYAVSVMGETNAEMVGWNTYIVKNKQIEKAKDIIFSCYDSVNMQAALISNYSSNFYYGDFIRAVWGKLYKASIIQNNNIFFNEELYIGEDAVFLMEYMCYVRSAIFTNVFGYYYHVLSCSAVRRYKSDLYNQSIIQVRMLESLSKKNCELIECSLYILQWMILHDLLDNINKAPQNKKDYSDIYKWYAYMRHSQFVGKRNVSWVGKLVRVQMLLGTRIPTRIQIFIMNTYDTLKRITNGR